MAVNTLAALFIVFYYVTVLTIGVWAGRKVHITNQRTYFRRSSKSRAKHDEDEAFLLRLFVSNRKVTLFLGLGSMTATWVGGGYLNGAAEAVYSAGLVWCQAPMGYAVSLLLGGWLFAGKMRSTNSLTMLDPFQRHYGKWVAVLLVIPAVCGEVFWTAAILSALGSTVHVIVEVDDMVVSIIISSAVILFYTSLGGYYSVVYTDMFQLITTTVGLWVCVPYVLGHDAVGTIHPPDNDWIGELNTDEMGIALDFFLMTAFGGIPWQVYFQRVLATQSVFDAEMLSYVAALGCLLLALPPIIIGAAAKTANFTSANYDGPFRLKPEDVASALPFSIRCFTPYLVSVLGMAAIVAAVMSSADSSMLSAASMVTQNIYRVLLSPKAPDLQVAIVLRVSVCVIGVMATALALTVHSVYALWTLSSDLVYVLLFPQLVCVFYLQEESNSYGSVCAFLIGGFFRFLSGEPSMGVPVVLQYPYYDENVGQRFPFRTFCMAVSFASLVLASRAAEYLFVNNILSKNMDICKCFSSAEYTPEKASEISKGPKSPRQMPAVSSEAASTITKASSKSHTKSSTK